MNAAANDGLTQDPNRNAWVARQLCATFKQAGVAGAVLCPGNRNVPLLFALQQTFKENHYTHIDERSAAFMALGMAKQLQQAIIINMTSGSALANVLPALCEAHAAHVPIIILSADRPDYLHNSGAPQCMQQQHIFKDFVAHSLHFDFTNADVGTVHLALMQINNALESCFAQCPAPIHINIAFDDPLPPIPDPNWVNVNDPRLDQEKNPFKAPLVYHCSALPEQITQAVTGKQRGLIICGPDAAIQRSDLITLAHQTGFPVLADAASNLRHSDVPQLICSADLLLSGPLADAPCDVLIRIGAAPISRPVYEYCARQICPVIRIDHHEVRKDFLHEKFLLLQSPTNDCIAALAQTCASVDTAWQQQWVHAEQQAQTQIQHFLQSSDWGECTAAAILCQQSVFALLQCANSMAVRHANAFCTASEKQFITHRGVNGIDGSIGSFIGACLATGKTSALLCGDIAFLHDLPALSAAKYMQHPACIIIMNNHGGRIFDLLPAAQCAGFEALMTTEQDADFQAIAAGFNIPFSRCADANEFEAALSTQAQQTGLSIIEVLVSANSLRQQWTALKSLVCT